jgi:hypothetical protein
VAPLLGGLKSKVHVAQNWPNLEKRLSFLQFSSKLSEFFFCERYDSSSSFSFTRQRLEAYFFG